MANKKNCEQPVYNCTDCEVSLPIKCLDFGAFTHPFFKSQKLNSEYVFKSMLDAINTNNLYLASDCARSFFSLPARPNATQALQAILDKACYFKDGQSSVSDGKVKITQLDKTPSYLLDAIELGDCLKKSVKDVGGNERLFIEVDFTCLSTKLNIQNNCEDLVISAQNVSILSDNCNCGGSSNCVGTWVDSNPLEVRTIASSNFAVVLQKKEVTNCGDERWTNIQDVTWDTNATSTSCSTAYQGRASINLATTIQSPYTVEYGLSTVLGVVYQSSPIFDDLVSGDIYQFFVRVVQAPQQIFSGYLTAAPNCVNEANSCAAGVCSFSGNLITPFLKNNCTSGTGSTVYYTELITGTGSTPALAQADYTAKRNAALVAGSPYMVAGQNNANTNGSCCSPLTITNISGKVNNVEVADTQILAPGAVIALSSTLSRLITAGEVVSYSWSSNVSAGTFSNQGSFYPKQTPNPNYEATTVGVHTITLQINYCNGGVATLSKSFTVGSSTVLTCPTSITVGSITSLVNNVATSNIQANQQVVLSSTDVISPSSNTLPTTTIWSVTFGGTAVQTATPTASTTSFTPTTAGSYVVTKTVSCGSVTGTETLAITVTATTSSSVTISNISGSGDIAEPRLSYNFLPSAAGIVSIGLYTFTNGIYTLVGNAITTNVGSSFVASSAIYPGVSANVSYYLGVTPQGGVTFYSSSPFVFTNSSQYLYEFLGCNLPLGYVNIYSSVLLPTTQQLVYAGNIYEIVGLITGTPTANVLSSGQYTLTSGQTC